MNKPDEEMDALSQLTQLERENRKLKREIIHLKNAILQEKVASTTALNHYKASTFIQRERERYLALLLANSPSIILILNSANRIEFCTEYFIAKAALKNIAEVQGHTLTEALSPFLSAEIHEKLLEEVDNVVNSNSPLTLDMRFLFDKEGSAEDFAGLLVPMKDEQQQSNGIMLMFHDVTALKRSREEALAASKAKSTFLSNMSHEIRTPMNAIIGMTAIGKQEKDPGRKDYAFAKIENASTHLLGIINDILDISKIESGKMELSPIVFSFAKMLRRVLGVINLKIRDRQQHFSVSIDPKIPKELVGDDQRLAQVIANILSNAIKFTPEDGNIALAAKLLSARKDVCNIEISVKDSGIGMSKAEQGKLFNIFQQAQAGTARKYGGSGLGLSISKRILELMDGSIWVESEEGKGSCFIFTAQFGIPNEHEITASVEQEEEAGLAGASTLSTDFSGKVVLLADDVDINLEIVTTLLEPTHITIDTARDGQEAFELFVANPSRYDLIFMDVQMPEVDGLQATRMIRELSIPRAVSIPVVAMTANVFKEDIEKCIEAGMNDHLGKPIVIEDVVNMLSKYLRNS